MPTISIGGLGLTFGDERGFPQGRGDTTSVFADNVSYVRAAIPSNSAVNTVISATATSTAIQDSWCSTIRRISSMETLLFSQEHRQRCQPYQRNSIDFYGMDSFKVKPFLTLELGMRYAWNMTPTEASGRFLNFVPGGATGSMLVPVSQPYAQSNKNFQPRVGFAWDVFHTGRTVLRGGYAYQVDEPITGIVTGLLNNNPAFVIPLSIATQQSFAATQTLYNSPTPASIAPIFVNPNFKDANVQSFKLNIQQQLTKSSSMIIGYFGNKGTHLENDTTQTRLLCSARWVQAQRTRICPSSAYHPAARHFPNSPLAASITERESGSNSIYNALWTTFTQKVSHGLQLNASYTYAHSIDDVSRNNGGIQVQNSNDIFLSRGHSDFDVRHRIVANAIYDLPFKGNRLVSGWNWRLSSAGRLVIGLTWLHSTRPASMVLAAR